MIVKFSYWKHLKTKELWVVWATDKERVYIKNVISGYSRNVRYNIFLKKYKLDKAANLLYGNKN